MTMKPQYTDSQDPSRSEDDLDNSVGKERHYSSKIMLGHFTKGPMIITFKCLLLMSIFSSIYAEDPLNGNETSLVQSRDNSVKSTAIETLFTACNIEPNYIIYKALTFGTVILVLFFSLVYFFGRLMVDGLCDKVFQEVDFDGNGAVDVHELYTAILLVYFRINKIVRIKPPSRKKILEQFRFSGGISPSQFREVMWIFVKSTFVRIFCVITLMLATPLVSPRVVDFTIKCSEMSGLNEYIKHRLTPCQKIAINEYMPFLNRQLAITLTSVALVTFVLPLVFDVIDSHHSVDISFNYEEAVSEDDSNPPLERLTQSGRRLSQPSPLRKIRKKSAHATGIHHYFR